MYSTENRVGNLPKTLNHNGLAKIPFFQPKLTINAPGDEYEQEADAMAEKVMRMPAKDQPFFSQKPLSISRLQRKCQHCEEEEKLQRKETSGEATIADTSTENYIGSLNGKGKSLTHEERSFFEPRFGYDFSNVQLHTNNEASQSAKSVNALAYTHGNNIVFGSGQHQSNTDNGKQLMAHELTHVVQQNNTIKTKKIQRAEADKLNSSEDNIALNSGDLLKSGVTLDAIELPSDEAARRVNQALDVMTGLVYIKRPPSFPNFVAVNEPEGDKPAIQTFPASIQRASGDSSFLAKVKGGVVGSIQICVDVLTGICKIKGWIWAGVGYEAPFVGWLGGYYFGEKTWWEGTSDGLKLFAPGTCRSDCEKNKTVEAETGWGIAGFPWEIKPNRQRAKFSKAGVEIGVLVTPNSFCDGDLEFIALINLLGYLGPIATVLTKAVDGINVFTHDTPHVGLQAGIDVSATFHICRGDQSLFAIDHADFCGGGFIDGGLGLSHNKSQNHGAS